MDSFKAAGAQSRYSARLLTQQFQSEREGTNWADLGLRAPAPAPGPPSCCSGQLLSLLAPCRGRWGVLWAVKGKGGGLAGACEAHKSWAAGPIGCAGVQVAVVGLETRSGGPISPGMRRVTAGWVAQEAELNFFCSVSGCRPGMVVQAAGVGRKGVQPHPSLLGWGRVPQPAGLQGLGWEAGEGGGLEVMGDLPDAGKQVETAGRLSPHFPSQAAQGTQIRNLLTPTCWCSAQTLWSAPRCLPRVWLGPAMTRMGVRGCGPRRKWTQTLVGPRRVTRLGAGEQGRLGKVLPGTHTCRALQPPATGGP
uniref:uncharacterized protein LOC118145044 n=1 Tax=Callithrix jacchus TaxID=9483 RepID=UPI0023DD49F6|nr:uncharacterized protein LOC118145044 [Callithrix jacchus]